MHGMHSALSFLDGKISAIQVTPIIIIIIIIIIVIVIKFTFMSDRGYCVVDFFFFFFYPAVDVILSKTIVVEDMIESDHMPVELCSNFILTHIHV